MIRWIPAIDRRPGPRYAAIADALADDIAAGRLPPGKRLPTHRALAAALGVTISTVTRAYDEARRRGLVAGEVGRGTYVRERAPDRAHVLTGTACGTNFVDLSYNLPTVGPSHALVERHLTELGRTNLSPLLAYGPTVGLPAHREAGAEWISRRIGRVDPGRVVVTTGTQNGMMLAIAVLARPGDTVLAESLSFFGMKSAATLLGVRMVGVPLDEHGVMPDALEAACRQHAPKAIYLIPTFQSPTASVMPFKRRELVVAICRRYGVTIIEDDINGFLDESTVPLAALAPEGCVYLTSFSKSIGGGMRLGYLYASPGTVASVAAAVRVTTNGTMPLAAELAARMIRSGDALRSAAWHRELAWRRLGLAREMLKGADIRAHPGASEFWMHLPPRWTDQEFADAVRARGVAVMPSRAFAVDRPEGPAAVRVAHCAPDCEADLVRGIDVLAEMLRETPAAVAAASAAPRRSEALSA